MQTRKSSERVDERLGLYCHIHARCFTFEASLRAYSHIELRWKPQDLLIGDTNFVKDGLLLFFSVIVKLTMPCVLFSDGIIHTTKTFITRSMRKYVFTMYLRPVLLLASRISWNKLPAIQLILEAQPNLFFRSLLIKIWLVGF